MNETKSSGKRRLAMCLFTVLSAGVVLLMRMGYIPSTYITQSPAVMFPFSDFFIILCAGLCGWRYGLLMFEIIFWSEIFGRPNWVLSLYSLFLYLLIALISGICAERGAFRDGRGTIITFLAVELALGTVFFGIFNFMWQIDVQGVEVNSVLSVQTLPQTYLGVLPETALAVLCLRLWYRFAPEKAKRLLGVNESRRGASSLGAKMTALLLIEAIILSVAAAVFSLSLIAGYAGAEVGVRESITASLRLIFLIMSISLPLALLLNEIIAHIVVRPVNRMERFMRRYFEDDGRTPRAKAEESEQLNIRSHDEIGQLYESMKKMLRGMADHIATQERKAQLEADLQVAEAKSEAKSTFLSSMSHEIRTPINAVLGMDEMILRESTEENVLEYAENIRTAGGSLLGLVNDILDFSKIEAGKMDILPAEYETASVLNDLVNLVQKRAEDKGLLLTIEADENLPVKIYGDELRVKQVVTNILTNAVKYTERGGVTLRVSAEPSAQEGNIVLCVSVQDTGIGIKPEDMQKLFSAFERIEEERNRSVEGTGLGMNITQRLLAMTGSRLDVHSVYGEGSTFSFRLEQKVVDAAPMGDFSERFKASAAARGRYRESFTAPEARILAVDDTPMNLTVLRGLLKKTAVRLDTAESGKECLDLITKNAYDLIFLDHRMPEMDGVETLARTKTLAGNLNAATPVVALTANAVSGAREEYIALGFADYLAKPVDTAALEKLVLQYLPAEKVKPAAGETGAARSADASGLPPVEGLDWGFAALHLPERELLETALRDFYAALAPHADKLDGFYRSAAWEDYRILVHAMKSSAATVGVVPLAGVAKVLEFAARDGDTATVTALHEPFLREWRSYADKLQGVFGIGTETEGAQPYDAQTVRELLETVKTCMDDFDVDGADAAMERLKQIRLPEAMKGSFASLQMAMLDVDSDAACRLADELLKEA